MAGTTGRCFLYMDADRFFYAVEAIEQPELRDTSRPVIVGHNPDTAPRGIVTTANDVARALGIHSGLSCAIARRLAPDALFVPPRHAVYARYSRRLMDLLRTATPLLDQRSVDEAALQWDHYGFQRQPVLELRARVLGELGLSTSYGLASNLLVAKMASESAKREPDHLYRVEPGAEAQFLAPQPVRALLGVGPKAEQRLRGLGIQTIGHLAARSLGDLVDTFGASYGRYLHRAAHGEDDGDLSTDHVSKSISAEHTYGADTSDRATLWRTVQEQSDDVAQRLRQEGLLCGEVAVKLRYANWETLTRQMRLGAPTDDASILAAGAAALIRRHWDRSRPLRLVGVRASRLEPQPAARQLSLPG